MALDTIPRKNEGASEVPRATGWENIVRGRIPIGSSTPRRRRRSMILVRVRIARRVSDLRLNDFKGDAIRGTVRTGAHTVRRTQTRWLFRDARRRLCNGGGISRRRSASLKSTAGSTARRALATFPLCIITGSRRRLQRATLLLSGLTGLS